MPQHPSAQKRARQNVRRRTRNRYQVSRMRTMIKRLEATNEKAAAEELLNETKAYLDRLACRRVIHPNKAANYKSRLERYVQALEQGG